MTRAHATIPGHLRRTLSILALIVGASSLTGGCATQPPPHSPLTRVILLPDEDGHVGAISLSTASGSQQLDQAYSATTAAASASAPSVPRVLAPEKVQTTYGALLRAQPPPPISFTLHFELDKMVLTAESKALLPALLDAVRMRSPTEITVYGHADASGSEERNIKLAAERANVVADLLRKEDPTLLRIDVQSFGDKVPLVPSPSRGPEPRNRRAEVTVL